MIIIQFLGDTIKCFFSNFCHFCFCILFWRIFGCFPPRAPIIARRCGPPRTRQNLALTRSLTHLLSQSSTRIVKMHRLLSTLECYTTLASYARFAWVFCIERPLAIGPSCIMHHLREIRFDCSKPDVQYESKNEECYVTKKLFKLFSN